MRRPGDEFKTTQTPGAAVPESALAVMHGSANRPMVEQHYAGGSRHAAVVLEGLELDLRAHARAQTATTRMVAEGLRACLGAVNGSCPGASQDLRGLLEDVTSPAVHLTLDDVLGRVAAIRWKVS